MDINSRFKKIFLIIAVITLVLSVSSYIFAQEKLNYKLVEEEDFSYLNCVRKGFRVVVQEDITRGEIDKIAKTICKQKEKTVPGLKEVWIGFYYPDLNVNKDTPNAVAAWNWGGSGNWEISYTFLRVKQPELVDETDKSILKQDEFRKGIFVIYDLIIPSSTLDKEAEEILKSKLNNLKEEWQNRVEWLRLDLFLGENYLPFMKGEWVSERSSRPKKGINIEIDEDGRHQAKEQTEILSSEQMRRKIYCELDQCEDKAREEADRLYPTDPMKSRYWEENIMKNIDKEDELYEKCKRKILKKYGLIEKHLTKIMVEGVRKSWPGT